MLLTNNLLPVSERHIDFVDIVKAKYEEDSVTQLHHPLHLLITVHHLACHLLVPCHSFMYSLSQQGACLLTQHSIQWAH